MEEGQLEKLSSLLKRSLLRGGAGEPGTARIFLSASLPLTLYSSPSSPSVSSPSFLPQLVSLYCIRPGMSTYCAVPQFLRFALPISRRLNDCVPPPVQSSPPPSPRPDLTTPPWWRQFPYPYLLPGGWLNLARSSGAAVARTGSQEVGTKLGKQSPGLCPSTGQSAPHHPADSCSFPNLASRVRTLWRPLWGTTFLEARRIPKQAWGRRG